MVGSAHAREIDVVAKLRARDAHAVTLIDDISTAAATTAAAVVVTSNTKHKPGTP